MKFLILLLFLIIDFCLYIAEVLLLFYSSTKIIGVSYVIRGWVIGILLNAKKFKLGRGVYFVNPQYLEIEKNVQLFEGGHYIASRNGRIKIGSNSHIGRNSVLSGSGGITIGKNCAISSGVRIYSISNDFKNLDAKITEQIYRAPVLVGENVLIGANSVILPGVTIGANSVIGAGSVVNKDIPRNVIFGGVPAKLIRYK